MSPSAISVEKHAVSVLSCSVTPRVACSWCHVVEQDNSGARSNYTQLYFTCSKLSCSTVPVLYVYPWHYMEFQRGAFGILKGHFPFGFFPPFVCEVVMVTICGIWSREGTLRNMGNENRTMMNEVFFFCGFIYVRKNWGVRRVGWSWGGQ